MRHLYYAIKTFLNSYITAKHGFTYRNTDDPVIQTLVNNIALEVYNKKINERVKYFSNLFKALSNLDAKIENNHTILKAIDEHLASELKITEEQVLLKTIQETIEEFGHQIHPDGQMIFKHF